MLNRAVRNLASLQGSASTSRVLNLHATAVRSGRDPEHGAQPMFRHPALNRGIYIKHRLRPHEAELFNDGRAVATKILLPLDPQDLRSGGRYVFVAERGFDQVMRNVFGDRADADQHDRRLLALLDQLPSLDPFILREHLRRHGMQAAPCYFQLSEADLVNIQDFVETEIEPLVRMALNGDLGVSGEAGRLVQKMLSTTIDADLEPLRQVLGMATDQFAEGVFCWKGFLYYKWALQTVTERTASVSREIALIRPRGPQEAVIRDYIDATRDTLIVAVSQACLAATQILNVYDAGFADLVARGEPKAFREFLLAAPAMFVELGERLGAISHLVSFWTYRFPATRPAHVTPDELADIFRDFEQGLTFRATEMLLDW